MIKCRHFWRTRSWHHMDKKWYCHKCLIARARELAELSKIKKYVDYDINLTEKLWPINWSKND